MQGHTRSIQVRNYVQASIHGVTEQRKIITRTVRTCRKLTNLGVSNTNCTASKRLLLPLPFLPTITLVPAWNGWIAGCCRKERKLEMVICLMCMLISNNKALIELNKLEEMSMGLVAPTVLYCTVRSLLLLVDYPVKRLTTCCFVVSRVS